MCVRGTVPAHPPAHTPSFPRVTGSILLSSSSPRRAESNSFFRIPRVSPALPWLLSEVAFLISSSAIQDRGGYRLEVIMFLSWGNVLSNSASPCIRCRKMALKFTRACFHQADRIYYAITLLHKSRGDPTEPGLFYPDPGFSQHVLAEPLDFCFKLIAGMLRLSQGRPAEIARIDFTVSAKVRLETSYLACQASDITPTCTLFPLISECQGWLVRLPSPPWFLSSSRFNFVVLVGKVAWW